jgi:hypothetical protein
MLDMIHYKKFPFTELLGKLPCSQKPLGIPVMNQTHRIQINHLILLKWTFSSYHYRAAVITMTQIYAERSGVQIFAAGRELSLLQNIQINSSTYSHSNF